jgi:diguanylate cyclase (GGDEF)-like protein
MKQPPRPPNETQRLETLESLDILDSPPEERFDRYTRLAKRLFGVPIALVSLVDKDRQWFKSRQGLEATETPREISFCGHAILGDEIFLVADTQKDERFADNPLVSEDPNIRFYAGYPLKAPDGSKVGTLCIIDRVPHDMGDDDARALRDLGELVEQELAALSIASSDELTGLANRRGFFAVARHSLASCRRLKRDAALLFFDLDRLKHINDRLGHAVGDQTLVEFAGILHEEFRGSDVVARLGGDEFCVLLTDASRESLAVPLERLANSVAARNRSPDRTYTLAYSVGTVFLDHRVDESIDDMLRKADEYMYEQKRGKYRD